MPSNDNNIDLCGNPARTGNGQGQAALILVESFIHGLIERSVVTATDALEIVTAAIEVQDDYKAEEAEGDTAMAEALTLLSSIEASLKTDLLPMNAVTEANDHR